MKTQTQKTDETICISREKLVSIVSQLFGETSGNPNPDEPLKPGHWDPIISQIIYRLGEPHPIPWQFDRFDSNQTRLEVFARFNQLILEVIGGGRFNTAELNPPPIPPRAAFLNAFAREAIDRIVLMQEIADAINQTGEQRGKVVISSKLSQLVDELCGNNIIIKFPIPHPKHDADSKLSGVELLTAGAIFEQTAKNIAREDLRQELRNAGAKLIETGITRI